MLGKRNRLVRNNIRRCVLIDLLSVFFRLSLQVLQVKNEALAKVKAENEAKRQKLAEWDQIIEELSKQ